ncbi:MAG: membrane protein insertion efficiency factor YidD [Thermodesulfobacteriota bacterium]
MKGSALAAGALVIGTAALLLLAPAPVQGAWDPPGWRRPDAEAAAPARAQGSTSAAGVALEWAVRAYRATVSRVDGDRCPSHPTCSQYALEAVRHHGPLLGAVLTAGRLQAEADEAAFAPRIFVGGRWKVYSPVEDDLAFLRGRLEP